MNTAEVRVEQRQRDGGARMQRGAARGRVPLSPLCLLTLRQRPVGKVLLPVADNGMPKPGAASTTLSELALLLWAQWRQMKRSVARFTLTDGLHGERWAVVDEMIAY